MPTEPTRSLMEALNRAFNDAKRDAVVGLRSLRKAPTFSAATILTLAIGIAAVSAMFSAVNGVLLRSLPVEDDATLVLIRKELPRDGTLAPFGYSDMAAFEERGGVVAVAGVQYDGAFPWIVVDGDRAVTMMGTAVSGTFFQVLGVRPALGRLLEKGDAREGAEPVVVLSYALWERAFGRDPGVLGRRLRVNGEPQTIVGVAPRDLEYPSGVELWAPLPPIMLPNGRELQAFSLLARLRPGGTAEEAGAAASAMLKAREAQLPAGSPRGFRAAAMPLRDAVVGPARLPLLAAAAAVGLVFVVTLLNVTALMLLRGLARAPEIRLRSMLGARPGRLARQLLAEAAILGVGGALIGVVLAWWLVRGLVLLAPESLPRLSNVRVDVATVGTAAALAALGTLLLSLGPGLHQIRAAIRPSGTLRTTGAGDRPTARLRDALVAVQVALAFVVAVGAGLLAKSFARMQQVDLGFAVEALTLARVDIAGAAAPEQVQPAMAALTERLGAVPGLAGATPVLTAPFSGRSGWDAFFTAEGQGPDEAAVNPGLNLEAVHPGYFATMQLPLLRGRALDERDRRGGEAVVVVSGELARRVWPGENAIGKRLKFGGADATTPWHTVVGVAADARYRDLLAPPPTVYVSLAQTEHYPRWLIVRTRSPVVDVRQAVERALDEVAPGSRVFSATPLRELLAGPLARPRFVTALLVAFATLALALAAIGLYGTVASMVARRRREIAVRMALGSSPGGIRRLVLTRGLTIAGTGLAAGVLLAAAVTRWLGSMLFGVGPLDVPVLLTMAGALAAIAALACYVPSGRAAAVPPASALRAE